MDFLGPDLATFWQEGDPSTLKCLVCHRTFTNDALVRTFKLTERDNPAVHSTENYSKAVRLRSGQEVLFFDRHLDCLRNIPARFAAVSHVWDPDISKTQKGGFHSPQDQRIIRLAVDSPVRISQGLRKFPGMEDYECWHDYFSVPQWSSKHKSRIVLVIHELFHRAHATVVYMNDVTPDHVTKLYHGTRSEDRLSALTAICNSRWYKRLWTAMEFVRSTTIRMMTSDCRIPQIAANDPIFWDRLHRVWDEERQRFGSVHGLEDHLKLGHNMVPWSLGALIPVQKQGRVAFASAFALLSRRGCRDERDFFHALRGIVVGGTETRPLEKKLEEELDRTAGECLRVGDLSPLLMTPALKLPIKDPRDTKEAIYRDGYNDIMTWGLLNQEKPPERSILESIQVNIPERIVTIKLEKIGLVSTVRFTHHWNPKRDFGRCAMLAFQQTGPDLDQFVATLVTRLYGGNDKLIMSRLHANGLAAKLQSVLNTRYDEMGFEHWPAEGDNNAEWLAKTLEISGYRDALLGHASTIHCRANCHILGITCTTCHETFIFRVASFVPASQLRHAVAYRIAGLEYTISIPNGMALLVRESRIVGRMMWATPACECKQMEEVIIRMPEFPRHLDRDREIQVG